MTIYTLGKRVARRVALHRHGMEQQPFCHAEYTTWTDPLENAELRNSLPGSSLGTEVIRLPTAVAAEEA